MKVEWMKKYLKQIYKNLIRFALLLAIRTLSLFPRSKYLISDAIEDLRHNIIKININFHNLKFYEVNSLIKYRVNTITSKEPDTIEWINSIPTSEVVWDIGSNIGIYSIYSAVIKNLKCVSVEMSPLNLINLTKNIILNQCEDKIQILPFGLTSNTGVEPVFYSQVNFKEGGAHNSVRFPVNQFGEHMDKNFQLNTYVTKIDELIHLKGIWKPNHLKIDVDGLELEILKGAEQTLVSVKSLLVEIDNKSKFQIDLEKFLKNLGFILLDNPWYIATKNQIWKNGVFES